MLVNMFSVIILERIETFDKYDPIQHKKIRELIIHSYTNNNAIIFCCKSVFHAKGIDKQFKIPQTHAILVGLFGRRKKFAII